jgi:hypothetical protein
MSLICDQKRDQTRPRITVFSLVIFEGKNCLKLTLPDIITNFEPFLAECCLPLVKY